MAIPTWWPLWKSLADQLGSTASLIPVFSLLGYHKKVPHTGWLKKEISFLPVLEASSLKSRRQQKPAAFSQLRGFQQSLLLLGRSSISPIYAFIHTAVFPLHVYLYACFFSSYYKDPSYVGLMGLPGSSVVKNPPNAGGGGGWGWGSIPWLGRSPGEGSGHPLQYSCLGNPMDRGAWRATVHGVARADHDWKTTSVGLRAHSIPTWPHLN